MSNKEKIPAPNYTQMPNALLDQTRLLSEAELKVTLIIARKTFGWHKQKEKLSLSELAALTGLSRTSVLKGIELGIKRGTIVRESEDGSYIYGLSVSEPALVQNLNQPSAKFEPALVQNLNQPSAKFEPALVQNLNQPNKEERNTKKNIKETHTQSKSSDAKASVCVEEKSGSQFSLDEREMYAEVFKLGEGWLINSASGCYDHSMRKWFNKQIEQTIADSSAKPKRCGGCGVQTETPCHEDPAICPLAPPLAISEAV